MCDPFRENPAVLAYWVTALNVTRIWIELAVWAAMVSTARFSLSGSRLMPLLVTMLTLTGRENFA